MVVLGLLFASPALAAFPGSNGLLAVQPVSGGGILLVGSNGHVVRRICTVEPRCGTPRRPRWSPDGRAIVYAAPPPNTRIVYTDGSCMDCRFGAAPDPAFEASGTLISFSQRGRVTVDGIDTLRKPAPAVSGVTNSVWSATGELAAVRDGALSAGRPSRLSRLARGGQPSWSPRGDSIAAVQRGWVVIIGVRNHDTQRLARGSSRPSRPTGGGSRSWPPASYGTVAYMGCLYADGRERLLERITNIPDEVFFAHAALVAAPFAALVMRDDNVHDGVLTDTMEVFDLRTGELRKDLGGE